MKIKIKKQPLIMPMPALLVGTYSVNDIPDAMTAAWTGVCCSSPLSVGVAIRQSRVTYENIEERGAFTLNVPNTKQAKGVDYLGIVSFAQNPNKLEVAGFETKKADNVDAPIIVNCPINVECSLTRKIELGTHIYCIGEVKEVHVDEEMINEEGNLNIEGLDPLIFIPKESKYYSLGKPVGKAFNMGKELK